jgi:hypothetical protein
MEERKVNIMLNATAELNRKETDDIYIPIRSSEYRKLISGYYEMEKKLEAEKDDATRWGSEAYRSGQRIKDLESELNDLRQKLAEAKEAAE